MQAAARKLVAERSYRVAILRKSAKATFNGVAVAVEIDEKQFF